jgi:hypothetical protein
VIALLLAAIPALDCSAAGREKLPTPGVQWKISEATATRAPWVDANGWRFERNPAGRYRYELPAGAAALALAEAFAYNADAVLCIDPADKPEYERMRSWLEKLPPGPLTPRVNLAVIDDGSDLAAEILNLLARRNLLFRVLKSAAPGYDLTLRIPGQAVDPDEFALQARRDLGDAKRLVRVFGSDVVLARLTGDAARARLHLLNYSRQKIEGLHVRVRGEYPKVSLTPVEDLTVTNGATEFTLSEMGVYATVDLAGPVR